MDPDPGGPKTYGSDGSGFATLDQSNLKSESGNGWSPASSIGLQAHGADQWTALDPGLAATRQGSHSHHVEGQF
jgi:hypothetical protein